MRDSAEPGFFDDHDGDADDDDVGEHITWNFVTNYCNGAAVFLLHLSTGL